VKVNFFLIVSFLLILITPIFYNEAKAERLRASEKGKGDAAIIVKELTCGKKFLNLKEVLFGNQAQCVEDEELFRKYKWTISGRVNTFDTVLPPNLIHEAGEFPIKIYWAYNNELSKHIGLNLVGYLGKNVLVTIYNLREPLPDFMKPRVEALGVVLKSGGTIVGAYIEAGKHDSFACSLDRKSLREITNNEWGEWIDNYIDYDNEIEYKLAKMKPKEIIEEYFNALNRHDRVMQMACLSRKKLCDYLSMNTDNSFLYNKHYPEELFRSVKITQIEELRYLAKINPPGVIEYEVTGEFCLTDKGKVLYQEGKNHLYVQLNQETPRGGWRIDQIGSGA
jgi:hypothetical protein